MSGGQCIKTKKTLKIISACVLHAWFSRKQLNRKRAWPRTLFRVNATWRDNECARKIINFGTDVWSGTSKKLNLFLFLGKPYSYLLSPTYRSSISTKKWGYVGIIMKINLYFFRKYRLIFPRVNRCSTVLLQTLATWKFWSNMAQKNSGYVITLKSHENGFAPWVFQKKPV